MTSISYEDIFSEFLGYVTDYELAIIDEEDSLALLDEWLHKAVRPAYVREIFLSLAFNDEEETLDFELKDVSKDELADADFVLDVLSKAMVISWLEPKVKKTSLINQLIGGKEQKFYSQAPHLQQVRELFTDTKDEVKRMIRDRGYLYNSYLEET